MLLTARAPASPSIVTDASFVPELAAVLGAVAQLLLDADELVVLGDPVAPRGGAGLDLSAVRRDRDVRDRAVFGLAGPLVSLVSCGSLVSRAGRGAAPARAGVPPWGGGGFHRRERLGQGADL